jgi:hypothetical protein
MQVLQMFSFTEAIICILFTFMSILEAILYKSCYPSLTDNLIENSALVHLVCGNSHKGSEIVKWGVSHIFDHHPEQGYHYRWLTG